MNLGQPGRDAPVVVPAGPPATPAPPGKGEPSVRLRELVLHAGLVGIGAYAAIESFRFPKPFPTGPGLIPMIAAAILVVFGVSGIVKTLRLPRAVGEPIAWFRFARLGVAVVAYLVLLTVTSFLPATFVGGLLVSESARDRGDIGRLHRHWQELLIVAVIVVAIYFLFQSVLHTQLP